MDMEAARTVARETVNETFLALGVDLRSPGEAINVQQDFAFMRSSRLTMRSVKTSLRNAVITAVVTSLLGGVATLIWHSISSAKATVPIIPWVHNG